MVATLASSINRLADLRVLLALTAVFGLVATQTGRGTLAFFTDTATSTGNTFTSGNVDLKLESTTLTGDCTGGGTDTLANALFNSSAENKAGDVRTQALCVENDGTINLQWGLAFTETSIAANTPLGKVLTIRVHKTAATTDDCVANLTSSATPVALGTGVELLAPVAILSGAGASQATITSTAATAVNAAAIMRLCVSVVVDEDVVDDFTSGATSAQNRDFAGTFTFTGTQV